MAVRITDTDRAEVTAFVRAIQDAGVQLTGLNFAAGDMPAGDPRDLSNPEMTQAFRDSVDIAVGIAESLGTRAFNALYGNRIAVTSPATQDDVAVQNLGYAAQAADRIGATVLVEPVSGAPRYPLTTAADAVHIIDRVQPKCGVANLRLLADLYHLHVNGDDVGAAIGDYGDRVGHVQIADAPGRGEPGTGESPRTATSSSSPTWATTDTSASSTRRPDRTPSTGFPNRSWPHRRIIVTRRNEDLMSTIAFIGLGIMGGPMACHLVEAGHTVVGYDRRQNASRPWSRREARPPTPSSRRSRTPTWWRSWCPTPPMCRVSCSAMRASSPAPSPALW